MDQVSEKTKRRAAMGSWIKKALKFLNETGTYMNRTANVKLTITQSIWILQRTKFDIKTRNNIGIVIWKRFQIEFLQTII